MKQLFLIAALFVASSALAADLDLYIAVGGAIQTSGNVKYVNSMISSNEDPNTAVARMIFTTLTVKDADGTSVCNVSVEKAMVTKPAIFPLRFRVTYPKLTVFKGTKKYTLYGRFTIQGNPPQTTTSNDQHEWTHEFPFGGTPSCVRLVEGY